VGSVAKSKYCIALAVDDLVKRGRPIMATLTFRENIEDKAEAERRWKNLRQRIQRQFPALRGVHTWQRQSRGAWHIHAVWSHPIDVNWLRSVAVECGFGSQIVLRHVQKAQGGFDSWSARKVVDYICRYISRDLGESPDPDIKLVGYMGKARVSSQHFGWAKGVSKLYRRGVEAWHDLGLCEFSGPLHEQPFWFVVRLGWESLGDQEQEYLAATDSAVRRWFYAFDDPF